MGGMMGVGSLGMNKMIAAVAAVVLLAGCGATNQGAGAEVTVTETVTVTATPETAVPETEDDAIPDDDTFQPEEAPTSGLLAFGDRAELDGMMAVTIGAPEAVKIDAELWDFDPSFDKFLKVPVTVENIGSEPVSTADLMVQMLTGERAAETFQDSDAGIQGDPYATVLPGKKITFSNGYAVGEDEGLVVEVRQLFGEDAAYYEG